MTSSGVSAIVAGHGRLAEGLVSAVNMITGRGGSLCALSNEGLGAAEVGEALARAVAATGANVVFTDLPAGSCTLAARRLQRDHKDLFVVTGVNLPMLLEFVMHDGGDAAAVATAIERGREHVRLLAPAHDR